MTTKIYSKLDPSKLLHMIVRGVPEGRTNLCPEEQFLQCASLRLPKGITFKAHEHVWKYKPIAVIAQESWFVVSGAVLFIFYDIDETFLGKEVVMSGQATFTFFGGHNYEILTYDTIVMEYKTGPYLGKETDKTFL